MKVILEEGKLELKIAEKIMEVDKSEISQKLSEVLPCTEAIMILCRLPYIEVIVYDKTKRKISYAFRNAKLIHNALDETYNEDFNEETIYDMDEKIANIFNQYYC